MRRNQRKSGNQDGTFAEWRKTIDFRFSSRIKQYPIMGTAGHIGRQRRPNLRAFESFNELSGDASALGACHFVFHFGSLVSKCAPFVSHNPQFTRCTTEQQCDNHWCFAILEVFMKDPENKQRISIYVDRELVQKADELLSLAKCSSRSRTSNANKKAR